MIDIHATALTGLFVLAVLIGAWLWELAHGRDGDPYGRILAVSGVALHLLSSFPALAVVR